VLSVGKGGEPAGDWLAGTLPVGQRSNAVRPGGQHPTGLNWPVLSICHPDYRGATVIVATLATSATVSTAGTLAGWFNCDWGWCLSDDVHVRHARLAGFAVSWHPPTWKAWVYAPDGSEKVLTGYKAGLLVTLLGNGGSLTLSELAVLLYGADDSDARNKVHSRWADLRSDNEAWQRSFEYLRLPEQRFTVHLEHLDPIEDSSSVIPDDNRLSSLSEMLRMGRTKRIEDGLIAEQLRAYYGAQAAFMTSPSALSVAGRPPSVMFMPPAWRPSIPVDVQDISIGLDDGHVPGVNTPAVAEELRESGAVVRDAVTYALCGIRRSDDRIAFDLGWSSYGSFVSSCMLLEHQTIAGDRTLRDAWGPTLHELANNVHLHHGVGTASVFLLKDSAGQYRVVLGMRSSSVVRYPSSVAVAPSYFYQPVTASYAEEAGLFHQFAREVGEELFNVDEPTDTAIDPAYIFSHPAVSHLRDLFEAGELKGEYLGAGVDAVSGEVNLFLLWVETSGTFWQQWRSEFEGNDEWADPAANSGRRRLFGTPRWTANELRARLGIPWAETSRGALWAAWDRIGENPDDVLRRK